MNAFKNEKRREKEKENRMPNRSNRCVIFT